MRYVREIKKTINGMADVAFDAVEPLGELLIAVAQDAYIATNHVRRRIRVHLTQSTEGP